MDYCLRSMVKVKLGRFLRAKSQTFGRDKKSMFSSPKRHPYHDFPSSLAEEYLKELQAWQIPKSWSGRQVYYQDYQGVTVLHDAIALNCGDSVILEFCKIWNDPTDSKRRLDCHVAPPLTELILAQRSFELISQVVSLGGGLNKSNSWFAHHKRAFLKNVNVELFKPTHAAALHHDARLAQAMIEAGCSFMDEQLYIALAYGEIEVFKLLLNNSKKQLDWMKTIKLILQEYKTTVIDQLPSVAVLRTDMAKMQSNLKQLIKKQPPTSFHSSYLKEKACEFPKADEMLQYFETAGFPGTTQ